MTLHNNYEHIHGESCPCINCHNMRVATNKMTKFDLLKSMPEECSSKDIATLLEAFERIWSTYDISGYKRKIINDNIDWVEENLFNA